MILNLELVKRHLNVDYDDDDDLILSYAQAAEQAVERHINVPLAHLQAKSGGEVPAPVQQAMLLMTGTLYAHRESVTPMSLKEVPLCYKYLLDLYVNYGGQPECKPAH